MRFIAVLLFILFSSSAFAASFVRTQILMGDVPVRLTVRTDRARGKVFDAMETAFREARGIESRFSEWRAESEVSRVNKHPLKWIPVSRELMDILRKADGISRLMGGAFDITFASSNKKTSYKDIEYRFDPPMVRLKKKGMKLGISSIAKGYIVDRMALILLAQRFDDFLVDAGDLYAAGRWKIGIKDPANPERELCSVILQDQALSTSGLYERKNHIVDPSTKKPPTHQGSVSVIGKQSFVTSPLATGLFVLPREKWPPLPFPNQVVACP